MAGMEFEYDEKGGTFYYFFLSFYALVIIPLTYFFWPRSEPKEDADKLKKQCQCDQCHAKKQLLTSDSPWTKQKKRALKLVLFVGWVFFAFLVYKVSQVEIDFTEYDPFNELNVDRGATIKEIKSAYRKLSLIYHPDKETGDSKKFMRIAKAYAALTDEESRKNWEEHGNPDGPGAMQFGIALPKWIVEKQNSVWVLAAYGLAFMVILPLVVGTWWYKSIKYNSDQVLMDTTQLYYYFINKTPNMILKRAVMILAASFEFEKGHNPEVMERPSDNEEIPALMKDLPNLGEKNKEKPLCFPYSVKARALLHAHFSRLSLPPKSLEIDQQYILKKCPYLVNELSGLVANMTALGIAGRVPHIPRLDTIENVMKLSPMVVQALWDNKSPLLQLPHITEDMLRHFVNRKRNIRNIKEFASMSEDDRRSVLRSLVDHEYRDVMNVCCSMPSVVMTAKCQVVDEEDTSITAGSCVTVTVELERNTMEDILGRDYSEEALKVEDLKAEESMALEAGNEEEEEENKATESPKRKPKVWEKNKKKKGKAGKQKKKAAPKQAVVQRKPVSSEVAAKPEQEVQENGPSGDIKKKPKKEKDSDAEESNSDIESDNENSGSDNEFEGDAKTHEDDEEEWQQFQKDTKKDILDAKSKETHEVHCPYFPDVKQEWWWLYVADRKQHMLISAPIQVCTLKTDAQLELKFTAPSKPGTYTYTVFLRSDSYLDMDLFQNIKFEVKEAKKMESHPQWDQLSDEEDDQGGDRDDSGSDDSSAYTDSEED